MAGSGGLQCAPQLPVAFSGVLAETGFPTTSDIGQKFLPVRKYLRLVGRGSKVSCEYMSCFLFDFVLLRKIIQLQRVRRWLGRNRGGTSCYLSHSLPESPSHIFVCLFFGGATHGGAVYSCLCSGIPPGSANG